MAASSTKAKPRGRMAPLRDEALSRELADLMRRIALNYLDHGDQESAKVAARSAMNLGDALDRQQAAREQ